MSSAASCGLPIGICTLPLCSTAWMSRLVSGAPGLTTGPSLPPFRTDSRLSKESPPLLFEALWQPSQLLRRMGLTLLVKKETDCGENATFCCATATPAPPGTTLERATQEPIKRLTYRNRILATEAIVTRPGCQFGRCW